jgi:adhesin transport system outer membrane protein
VAEPVTDLRDAITRTVLKNPEVNASWYEFEASREEERAAKGGYLPSIDLNADIGRESSETPFRDNDNYTRDSTRLSLTQMLFDGFATSNEVDRLNYAKLARYYELKQVSEEAGQQAAQAYLDVLRFQQLVKLAEENYVQHRLIFDDVESRVNAGISRPVDLQQATGRLALAETNLLTESTNLYDVITTFQRIVGDLPAEFLAPPIISTELIPASRRQTVLRAYRYSPLLNAAIENLRSSQSALDAKNAPMMPRVDLRLRQDMEHDIDGIDGNYDEQAVELVFSYNLYRGGADKARKRQYYQRLNAVKELRAKACRDVRQTVAIAYNNIGSLKEQIEYLNTNQIATGKARVAYRKQFDIGQRSLLDLLDTENEYFDVRRAYVSATYDLKIAQTKTLAGMGLLLEALNVNGLDDKAANELELGRDDNPEISGRCPDEAPERRGVDKEALLAKVMADHRFRQLSGEKVAFNLDLKFDYMSAQLAEGYARDIEDAGDFLRQHPSITGIIEGYSDSVGSQRYNLKLSQQRAESVRAALVARGIAPERLRAIGYGEERPIADNSSEQGRSQNRRVELVMQAEEKPTQTRGVSSFSEL